MGKSVLEVIATQMARKESFPSTVKEYITKEFCRSSFFRYLKFYIHD